MENEFLCCRGFETKGRNAGNKVLVLVLVYSADFQFSDTLIGLTKEKPRNVVLKCTPQGGGIVNLSPTVSGTVGPR